MIFFLLVHELKFALNFNFIHDILAHEAVRIQLSQSRAEFYSQWNFQCFFFASRDGFHFIREPFSSAMRCIESHKFVNNRRKKINYRIPVAEDADSVLHFSLSNLMRFWDERLMTLGAIGGRMIRACYKYGISVFFSLKLSVLFMRWSRFLFRRKRHDWNLSVEMISFRCRECDQLSVACSMFGSSSRMKRGNTVDNCNFLSRQSFCTIWIAILFSLLLTKQQRHVTDRKLFARVFSSCMKLQFCCAFVITLNEIKIYGFGAFLILRSLALFRSFIPRKYSFDWLWIIKDFLCWWLAHERLLSCLHTCER